MQFSREWLAEYVEVDGGIAEVASEDLARKLTDLGLAVELIETVRPGAVDEDTVFDLDITTNRPDCMNHIGLAREAAAALGGTLRRPTVDLPAGKESTEVTITIEEGALCRRFVAVVLEDVTIGESPDWLRRRLEAIGHRPINNIVDVTNYVLWESGQPLHAYDLSTLAGEHIVVRRATDGETLKTLDGEERKLDPDMLIIADDERPIGLAGVMGGEATEVEPTTRRILLEGAWFDPKSVRKTARKLGMHTDASHRFERGTDLEGGRWGVERAAALMLEVAGGRRVAATFDVRGESFPSLPSIPLSHSRLEAFAGTRFDRAEVAARLEAIGFTLKPNDAGWRVTPPEWRRFDVLEVADLYEEVLRTLGFDRVPAALPPSAGPDAPESPVHALRRLVRRELAAAGYAEVINYAFYGAPEESLVLPLEGDGRLIEVQNPLSDRYRWMRRNLVAGVVSNGDFNRRRNLGAVQLFEIGHVFWCDEEFEPSEAEHLAIVLGGLLGTPWERPLDFDLFDLKGILESVADLVGVELTARAVDLQGLVPGVSAQLYRDGRVVGFLGELDEGATEGFPLFIAELDLGALLPLERPRPVQIPFRHPGIAVDLTLTHPIETPYSDIADAIDSQQVEDLVGFGLEARYQGKGVPSGSVNTTIHFRYNAEDRSLTQDEVNERQTVLADFLRDRFGSGGH
ncbi:MAG: phenylalanine--tRNA ligase subunit beta [Thermoanaerobaculia bacterium]|nr:phenylalanine--tRNA ligase subunit beta [Thermoanaerobaculia bacterium]